MYPICVHTLVFVAAAVNGAVGGASTKLSAAAIGTWLTLYADEFGDGDIKALAVRWGRPPQTLMIWRSVYRGTRNLPHAVDCLAFSRVSELARIPATHQAKWITPATEMKRSCKRA